MLETMSEDYIRTARAKGLPERDGGRQARPARRADPDPDDLRPRPRAAARRRDPHREHVLAARASASTPSTRSPTTTCRRCSASRWSARSSSSSPTSSWTSSTPSSTRGCGLVSPTTARLAGAARRPAPRGAGDPRRIAGAPALPRRPRPAGALPDRRRRGQVRRRAVASPRARQDPRHRRRVRLGQERDQPGDHGPAQAAAAPRSAARSGSTARSSSAPRPSRCASCAARRWR